MSLRNPYRRSSSPWRWLAMVLLFGAAVALGAVGYRTWQRPQQVAREADLENSIATLRAELQQRDARLAGLEGRLAAQEAADVVTQLAQLQADLDVLRAEVLAVKADLAARVPADQGTEGAVNVQSPPTAPGILPPEMRLVVARQMQSHSLSCESSAASMAAQYHAIALTEGEVLAALPRNANPHLGFRGQVDGPTGGIEDYGVYARPIAAVLNSRGVPAALVAGGLDGIKAALARGNPVIAWVTYNCQVSQPVDTMIDGQQVTLVPYQHAVVVTGYNAEGVWANDPYDGGEDYYSTADFERALSYFGDMAIEVAAPEP